MVEREGRRNGVGGEYPCLCAKTVALAVKCSYVGHANEGRYVLRCNPKCVEPSASPLCFFIVKKAQQPFFYAPRWSSTKKPLERKRVASVYASCGTRLASYRDAINICRSVSSQLIVVFSNASRIDFNKVAAVRFFKVISGIYIQCRVSFSVLPLVFIFEIEKI